MIYDIIQNLRFYLRMLIPDFHNYNIIVFMFALSVIGTSLVFF